MENVAGVKKKSNGLSWQVWPIAMGEMMAKGRLSKSRA